jgi:hypothetical protein
MVSIAQLAKTISNLLRLLKFKDTLNQILIERMLIKYAERVFHKICKVWVICFHMVLLKIPSTVFLSLVPDPIPLVRQMNL